MSVAKPNNPLTELRSLVAKLFALVGLNTPARVVIIISPILTLSAGWVVSLAARYLPGLPTLDSAQVTAIFIAGATMMATKLLMWLNGARQLDVLEANRVILHDENERHLRLVEPQYIYDRATPEPERTASWSEKPAPVPSDDQVTQIVPANPGDVPQRI